MSSAGDKISIGSQAAIDCCDCFHRLALPYVSPARRLTDDTLDVIAPVL